MKKSELLRLVWINIIHNKFKTIMTSIGIVVGAATLVMVIAIGKGGQADVADQFKNLNAGAIDISYQGNGASEKNSSGSGESGAGGMMGGGMPPGERLGSQDSGKGTQSGAPDGGGGGFEGGMPDMSAIFGGKNMEDRINQEKVTLSETDVEEIETFVSGVAEATISYTTKSAVEGGDLEEEESYTIAGIKSNYANISNLFMAVGEFITEEEDESKDKVCVMGASAADKIFGSAMEAYGSVIYIDSRLYVVNGVLEAMGSVASGISPDEAVFIPYETGIKYLVGTNVNPTVTVLAEDVNNVEGVTEDVADLLLESYPNTKFTYTDAGSKMEAASASNQILTMLLIAMAAIVFVVGGIGIMNVLFVSVRERTNEIGILKAIGCSRKNILFEFLLEASAISLIGGMLGMILSIFITPVVQKLGVRVELSAGAFFIAILFAAGTGTLFGFYPAYKASRLVPVKALSAE